MKTSIFFSFLLLVCFCANAQSTQTDCSNVLIAADKDYEAGRFSNCIEKLNNCMNSLAKQDRYEAYRLLSLCYMVTNEDQKANESMVQLLEHKPDYRDYPYFDPLEFTKLAAKYTVWSQLELGLKTGVNINSIRVIENYSINGLGGVYHPELGFQVGIIGEYFFKKNVSVALDLCYEGLNYSKTTIEPSDWTQEFTENLRYFSLPVTGKYYFLNQKGFRISAELGFQVQLLSQTNSTIEFTNQKTNEIIQKTAEQKNQRTNTLLYGLGGIAVYKKIGGGNVFMDIRYAYGFSNVVNAEKRNDNPEFSFTNQYIDSDIAFNPLYISFGYQFPIPQFYKAKLAQ
jgi:hypothetical protein